MSKPKINPQILLAYSGWIIAFSLVMRGVVAMTIDDLYSAPAQMINSLGGRGGGGEQPLPVPNQPPPVGNSADVSPCAPPPGYTAERPVQVAQSPAPVRRRAARTYWDAGGRTVTDIKAKTLMNAAPGTRGQSLAWNDRVGYPTRWANGRDYWDTSDGTIEVSYDGANRVTNVGFVQ